MKAALMTVRAVGALVLVLGLVMWTGGAPGFLVPIHMLLGIVLVIALIAAAVLGARRGLPTGFVVLTVVWALFTPVLGLNQQGLLPDAHVVVQVAHLLVGLVAIGLGEMIGARTKAATAAGRS